MGEDRQLNVVILPWLAQGHINPFLNLSKALATHGTVKVWFVSTPVNISRIRSRLHGDPIQLVELALPSVDGLPPGVECTADIKPESAHLLHRAFNQLDKPFESLLRRLSADIVIHDLPAHWTATVTAKLGIPTLVFDVYSPVASSYVRSQAMHRTNGDQMPQDLTRPPPDYPSPLISWRLFEANVMVGIFLPRPGGIKVTDLIYSAYQQSCGILIKSCFQEEEKYLQYLREATGKPIISVGPLMLPDAGANDASGDKDNKLVKWLDKQRPSSVVFVSFGSESFLSAEQITELASALEDSGLPFLWSLRSSEGTLSSISLLPEGFEERTRERGLVVGGWVPQVRIVSHPSVGSYVTHGGWSSVMEAWLYSALPLVLIPLRHDQGLNCRQIALELHAGIEVNRDEEGCFSREDVGKAIGIVMGKDEKGVVIRSRVEELRDVIRLNCARRQAIIQDLVNHLTLLVKK